MKIYFDLEVCTSSYHKAYKNEPSFFYFQKAVKTFIQDIMKCQCQHEDPTPAVTGAESSPQAGLQVGRQAGSEYSLEC